MAVRVFLSGFGSVNRGVAKILLQNQMHINGRRVVVTGITDSRGGIFGDEVDLDQALLTKLETSRLGESMQIEPEDYDIMLEGTPSSFVEPEKYPGLSLARKALAVGRSVVFASKAPLVVDFDGLMSLGKDHGGRIAYSATVCGGLPVINVLQRDLSLGKVTKIEGVFNSTSGYVLTMMQSSIDASLALKHAQEQGIAEADPTLDLNGFDTAAKLYIILKTINWPIDNFSQIEIEGIEDIKDVEGVRLVASAERGGKMPSVKPQKVQPGSFLDGLRNMDMGIVIESDLFETISMKTCESAVLPTSAAVVRDLGSMIA